MGVQHVDTEYCLLGASIVCYDLQGECVWLSEHKDSELERFVRLVSLPNGVLVGVAKQVSMDAIQMKPRFYTKVVVLDAKGNIDFEVVLDEFPYIEPTCAVAKDDRSVWVFANIKVDGHHKNSQCAAWLIDTQSKTCGDAVIINSSLEGSCQHIASTVGGFIVAGVGLPQEQSSYRTLVRKLAKNNCSVEWEQYLQCEDGDCFVESLAVDHSGNIYIAGSFSVGDNGFLTMAQLNPAGDLQWETQQSVPGRGKLGQSILLHNNRCYVFSCIYPINQKMPILCHQFTEQGEVTEISALESADNHNVPIFSHHKNTLWLAGNQNVSGLTCEVWIDSMPINNL